MDAVLTISCQEHTQDFSATINYTPLSIIVFHNNIDKITKYNIVKVVSTNVLILFHPATIQAHKWSKQSLKSNVLKVTELVLII